MTLKLDMRKASIRIEWCFLESMLQKVGFADKVGSIDSQVCFPRLDTRWSLGATKKYERRGWIHGCKVANGAPKISRMLFTDDSYLYYKATVQEAL
uniref:Uncharacterized protein n=1 Tax=Cannabis sativa TaxID=3483 RepID=A0A803PPQ5_CANSA